MSTKTAEAPAKKKRAKTVYPTDEIAHLWAHQTQEYAKNPGGNFFFIDDTIYSYGSHFPIARVFQVKHKRKLQNVVFFTTRSRSNTTSGHIHLVRRAIPGAWPTFYMDEPENTPEQALAYYVARVIEAKTEYETLAKTAAAATKYVKRAAAAKFAALSTYIHRRDIALRFAKFFQLPVTLRPPTKFKSECAALDAHEREAAAASVVCRERMKLAADARHAQDDAERELYRTDRPAYDRLMAERRAETLKKQAAKNAAALAKWRRGGHAYLPSNAPTMLRINGAVVQTSRGASFPLDHALRALPLIEAVLTRGEPFTRTIHLGHFTVDRIEEDGTLVAGCHHVAKEEVLRLIADIRERGLASSEPVAVANAAV